MDSRSGDGRSGIDASAVHAVRVDLTAGGSPSDAVVAAVANVRGVDPASLAPLHESVDTEALDALFDGRGDGSNRHVEFQYVGYDVTVRGDGRIVVAERA